MKYLVFILLAGLSAPAFARPPAYTYKADVADDVLAADEEICWNDAIKAMKDPKWENPWIRNPVTETTTAGAAGAAFGRGLAQGIEDGKRFKLTYYDCINAKGYRLLRPSKDDWKAYKKLSKDEQNRLMAQWRKASLPQHPEAPREEFD